MYPETTAFGAIVLNRSVGGINPHVVQAALQYGAKIVFMPSNHSKWHAEYFQTPDYPQLGRMQKQLPGNGVTVFDESGSLTPEAVEVVRLVADADVCLATGHLSIAEIRALLDAATANGVTKFLVTHANWALCRLELDVQRELIAAGAYLEYVAVSCCSPIFWEQKPDELAEWIEALGGDRLVLEFGPRPGVRSAPCRGHAYAAPVSAGCRGECRRTREDDKGQPRDAPRPVSVAPLLSTSTKWVI